MYSGVGTYPSALYRTYILLNWSIFAFLLIYGVYVANFLALRWADPVGDRWATFGWWRIAATAASIFPAWFLHQLMYHNAVSIYYTIHLWVSIIVGAIDGVSLAFLIVDWVNCENVSYCVHPTDPSAVDISFFFLFCGLAGLLFIIIVWIAVNRYLLERTEIKMMLAYYADENRPPFGMTNVQAGLFGGQTLPSGANIGASVDSVSITIPFDDDHEPLTAEQRSLYEAMRNLPGKLRLEAIIPIDPQCYSMRTTSRVGRSAAHTGAHSSSSSQEPDLEEDKALLKINAMKYSNV